MMGALETITCILVSVLSIGCLIYMIKSDTRAKRKQIYERIEEVENRVDELERGELRNERNCWKALRVLSLKVEELRNERNCWKALRVLSLKVEELRKELGRPS